MASSVEAALFLALALALPGCGPAPDPDATDADASDDTGAESETETETDGAPLPDSPADDTDSTDEECPPPPCEACTCEDGVLTCACFEAEAGFMELEGVDYTLGQGDDALARSSTDSRQFWAFQPADQDPESAPLFVFFNGGPGVSSGMLLGLSTGRASFAPGLTGPDVTVVDNPHSWTSLGNLLWIDARQTGFSYGLLDDPGDPDARGEAMSLDSFNSYRDAADFVRTILRFLAAHPELRANEVVLVAESYGGIRAQVMLDMLLHPDAYQDGSRKLDDPALAAQISAHHELVHGPIEGPEDIKVQFGRQILIQPTVTGSVQRFTAGQLFEQPDSIMEQLALELGVDFESCAEQGGPCNAWGNAITFVGNQNRSPYDLRAPYSWLDDLFGLVRGRLNDATTTQTLLGVEASAIVGLAAGERAGAWRTVSQDAYAADTALGDWPSVAGDLQSWDRYFAAINADALSEFNSFEARTLGLDPTDSHFGELFLSNVIWVDTLITEAAYDVIIYTPAIPVALETYDTIVANVLVDPDGQEWTIEYHDDVFGDGGQQPLSPGARVVSVPRYEASHAVTLDEPGKLRDDVELWLGP